VLAALEEDAMSEAVARDLMQTQVVTVDPETPLVDVQRLFVEEEINGAPVVSDDREILGVVTSLDVLRAVEEEHDTAASYSVYFRESLEFSGPDWSRMPEDFQDRLAQLTAADAMTKGVISVTADAPASQIARTLRSNHVHRVFVVEDGALLGVISTFDLIAVLEKR
jgi:CBS domain-containing protein